MIYLIINYYDYDWSKNQKINQTKQKENLFKGVWILVSFI
jgi:hypothetical protein